MEEKGITHSFLDIIWSSDAMKNKIIIKRVSESRKEKEKKGR